MFGCLRCRATTLRTLWYHVLTSIVPRPWSTLQNLKPSPAEVHRNEPTDLLCRLTGMSTRCLRSMFWAGIHGAIAVSPKQASI